MIILERIMLPGAGGRRTGAAYEELRRLPTSLLRETLEILGIPVTKSANGLLMMEEDL